MNTLKIPADERLAEHTVAFSMPLERLMVTLYMPLFTHLKYESRKNRFPDFIQGTDQLILEGGNPVVALALLRNVRDSIPRAYVNAKAQASALVEEAERVVRYCQDRA